MYYHPLMWDWMNKERALATFVGVWLDGIDRQQRAHADAASAFCARQMENVRMVAEARDAAQLAAGLLACAAPEPRGLADLSARLAGIVVDTHLELSNLLAAHSDEMTRSVVELDTTVEQPTKKATNGGPLAGRRRAAA